MKAEQLKICIIIPARLASTRLPRKLLLRETGQSVLQHTYEAALQAKLPGALIVAADHDEIAREARSFGAQVVMTSPDCASGTDRVAEVASALPEIDIFVNVQGDEPELDGRTIDEAARLLVEHADLQMATLATPIRSKEKLHDPACVKVVFAPVGISGGGRALYFSRSPIPHARTWDDSLLNAEPACFYQHIGLYAYRRDFLLQLASLPRTPLEKLESLEQLRVLEHGYGIGVGLVDEPTIGIDTPEDYRAFVERTAARRARAHRAA
jgi:3-deoxy-manno-octulosonate cytidylyltransferase (CMP-KDO synthetase)